MFFRHYGLPKTWLDNCLERPISENLSTDNMVNWPKHCCNLKGSSFTIFIGNCEGN